MFLCSWLVRSEQLKWMGERKDTYTPPSSRSCPFCSMVICPSPEMSQQEHCKSFVLFPKHIPDGTGLFPPVSHSTSQTLQQKELHDFLMTLFPHTNSMIVTSSIINTSEYFNKFLCSSFSLQGPDLRAQWKACFCIQLPATNATSFKFWLTPDWLILSSQCRNSH